jgi:hypothetical protein
VKQGIRTSGTLVVEAGGAVNAAQLANGEGVDSAADWEPEPEVQADVTAISNKTNGDQSHQRRRVTGRPVR